MRIENIINFLRLTRLTEIAFSLEDESNPVFKNKGPYLKTIKSLINFSSLKKIDGRSPNDLISQYKSEIADSNEPNYVSPIKEKETTNDPQKSRTIPKGVNPATAKRSTSKDRNQENSDPNYQEIESLRAENQSLQSKLHDLVKD
jgi:hypothetical protein